MEEEGEWKGAVGTLGVNETGLYVYCESDYMTINISQNSELNTKVNCNVCELKIIPQKS